MSFSPLISITLPNYNHGRYLVGSLESVLAQTYENFEILLTEDGSTDDSREIAERFARQDARVKPVYFETNRGAMAAHANTWNRVRGRIVYQYSSDDSLADRDFFRLGIEALTRYPSASGFFGVAALVSGETGRHLGEMGNASPEGFIGPRDFVNGFLSKGFFVPGISSLWRKSAIDAVGGYDIRLGPQADYFINHALPARSGVVYMHRHFANARVSEANQSFSSNTKLEHELQRLTLFAIKLREQTARFGEMETEWAAWRKHQAAHILAKYGLDAVQSCDLEHALANPVGGKGTRPDNPPAAP